MTATNPYADDATKAEVYELGYVAGFQDPGGSAFLPLAPDLLDLYQQGVDAGGVDNQQSSVAWVSHQKLAEETKDEWKEHVIIEVVAEIAKHLFKLAAFGLVGVVIEALSMSDTPLHPLEDDGDLSERYTGPSDDSNVTFLAMCSRTDHPMPDAHTTTDGYWVGAGSSDFGDALQEALSHGHREAIVARCSLTNNSCGPVWAAN